MNKKCLGCGIPLQDKDINLDGYISNIDKNICTRCFKIKNYGVYNKANMSNKDYTKIIDSITNNDLVIYVSSLLNLNIDYINKFKDVILVLTKRDILPKSVKDNKIIDYIKKRYNNIKDIIIISSIKNYNMDHLYNTILKYGIDKKIYFVGSTNSGKSTLINKLIKDYGNNDITITTSMYPSTTLDAINIKLNGLNIYDTPGIVNERSITNYINNNELKKINIKKEIKPITYQIKDKCSILIGDYIRLDFECISTSITIYISNNVPVKRISLNNPILLDNIISSYNDLKNKDIVIEDICFIKITKNTRVNIYGKYNLSTIIRDNLI